MSLIKSFEPLSPFRPRLSQLMDQFFDESVRRQDKTEGIIPQVDISEDKNQYEIQLAAPGIKKEDFSITFQSNQLTLSGQRQETQQESGTRYHRVESWRGTFKRVFNLPEKVKAESISAQYSDGILRVIIPKDTEANEKMQIQVK